MTDDKIPFKNNHIDSVQEKQQISPSSSGLKNGHLSESGPHARCNELKNTESLQPGCSKESANGQNGLIRVECKVSSPYSSPFGGYDYEESLSSDDDDDDNCYVYTYKGEHRDEPQANGSHSSRRIGVSDETDYLEMDFDPESGIELRPEEQPALEREPQEVNGNEVEVLGNVSSSEEGTSRLQNGLCNEEHVASMNSATPSDHPCETPLCVTKSRNEISEDLNATEKNEKCGIESQVSNISAHETKVVKGVCLRVIIPAYRELPWKNKETEVGEEQEKDENQGLMLYEYLHETEALDLIANHIFVTVYIILKMSNCSCSTQQIIQNSQILNIPGSLLKCNQDLFSYLLKRYNGTTTPSQLMRSVEISSKGQLYARFFPTYPKRDVSYFKWLSQWIRKGVIPVVTRHVQWLDEINRVSNIMPDPFMHQIVYKIGKKGAYLSEPEECVKESFLNKQLSRPSIMFIESSFILCGSYQIRNHDLRYLCTSKEFGEEWKDANVLGQIASLMRRKHTETMMSRVLRMPCAGRCGITLIVLRSSPAYMDVLNASELPLLNEAEDCSKT